MFYCAINCFKKGYNYRQTVDSLADIQDSDTDTNAAIAGALAGAFEVYKGMMSDKVTKKNYTVLCEVNRVDYIKITNELIFAIR